MEFLIGFGVFAGLFGGIWLLIEVRDAKREANYINRKNGWY